VTSAVAHAPIDVTQHTKLVWATINRYGYRFAARGALQLSDLYQAGLSGLLRAARTYDPALGAWSTYAVPWVRTFIARELANRNSVVRVSVHRQAKRIKNGERPCPYVRSIDTPLRGDTDTTLADLLEDDSIPAPDANLEKDDARRELHRLASEARLSAKEIRVVMLRAAGATHLDIGEEFGLCRERIRQIESKALRRLRAAAGYSANDHAPSLAEAFGKAERRVS
jgi:RNA polymerase sigma factor (sigma-70 family)